MLTLAFNIQPVKSEPTIWTVDDNGPADFHTIQEAINAANPGDTIYVHSGTYYENVVVNKTVSLIGENKVTTTIDGNMTATVVVITADDATISEFTLRNGGNRYAGISLSSNGNNITNNIIWNNWCGISLEHYSAYNVIANNSIMNNLNGISGELWSDSMIIGNVLKDNLLGIWIGPYSSHNTIAFNNIKNHWSEGISMWQSSYNTIVGNNITDNNQGGHWAGMVVGFSSYNQFFHNNIVNKGKQIDVQGEVVNTWDDGYPSGGNYWSDYEERYPDAEELDGSGIWDTPYFIDENNQDNYPLMRSWAPKPPAGTSLDLAKRKAWSEHHHYLTSKDEDEYQTLYGLVKNTGNVTIPAEQYKVVWTLTTPTGMTVYETTGTVDLAPGEMITLTYDIPLSELPIGRYYAEAKCYYYGIAGETTKVFTFKASK